MNELALFAGAGGGILGGHLLNWRTTCAVEIDPFCRKVLLSRQFDGMLPRFPIWDDICTFDGRPWRGHIDVVSGGFPCQDISSAGKGAGINGPKSGLWREFARVIGEVQPRFAFIENSPHLRGKGSLHQVLSDLSDLGYNARWGVLGARHVNAPHPRDRIWILAYPNDNRQRARSIDAETRLPPTPNRPNASLESQVQRSRWWPMDQLQGMVDGVANRMDRIKATGNGQVPGVAAMAFSILSKGL